MNPVPLEPPRWTKRHWIYSVAILFVLQVAIIMQLGRREERAVERPLFRTAVRLAVPGLDATPLEDAVRRDDPLLLALPTAQGFSGPAWLQFSPPDYQLPEATNPVYWLSLDSPKLAETFRHFVTTNAVSMRAADRSLPRLTRYEPVQTTEPIRTKSRLIITDELASRALLTPAELRSFPSSDILSNTVIRVAVDADGAASFVMLINQSGSRDADAYAEQFARDARFRSVRPPPGKTPATAPLTWGRLIFRWQTISTNSAPEG